MTREQLSEDVPKLPEKLIASVAAALHKSGVQDIGNYRRETVSAAVTARLRASALDTPEQYLEALGDGFEEIDELRDELLKNSTAFFRDPDVFDQLALDILPALLGSASRTGRPLRIWSVGCSTGEEVYSLAMLVSEWRRREGAEAHVRIYGSDNDAEAIERARLGRFSSSIREELSPARLRRHFTAREQHYVVNDDVETLCEFFGHDLHDAGPGVRRADLVLCLNVLEYFSDGAKERILTSLHAALRPGGRLICGPGVDLSAATDLFAPTPGEVDSYLAISAGEPPGERAAGVAAEPLAGMRLADECGAAIVVVDDDARIRFYNRVARERLNVGSELLGEALSDTPLAERFAGLVEDVAALLSESANGATARSRTLQDDDKAHWLLRLSRPRARSRLVVSLVGAPAPMADCEPESAPEPPGGAVRTNELAALGTLAAGIAHEINNPLNAIMMNAELGRFALEGEPDTAKLNQAFDVIIEDVKRCAGLTSSILKLARKRSTRKRPGDLNQVVREARRLIESELQMRDASIELALADLPPVALDDAAMESAIVNLLTNAANSAKRGVAIKVETRAEDEEVVLEVSDTGAGMPAPVVEHIFDPFFTTRQGEGGTGLGLSLVHATVTDHGGTISVDSVLGEGTAVTVRLSVHGDGPAR